MQKSSREADRIGSARRWEENLAHDTFSCLNILAYFSAQTQNAVHVIQIGNTFYDVIPIANPSASVTRCHHHSHCRRGIHLRHSDSSSSLNANSHTNPTFVLDEGVYPGGKRSKVSIWFCFNCLIPGPPAGLEAPPSYDEVIRLPNQYPKLNSTAVSPANENPPPTIAEIEASGHSITTITSVSPAVITNQQSRASVT